MTAHRVIYSEPLKIGRQKLLVVPGTRVLDAILVTKDKLKEIRVVLSRPASADGGIPKGLEMVQERWFTEVLDLSLVDVGKWRHIRSLADDSGIVWHILEETS